MLVSSQANLKDLLANPNPPTMHDDSWRIRRTQSQRPALRLDIGHPNVAPNVPKIRPLPAPPPSTMTTTTTTTMSIFSSAASTPTTAASSAFSPVLRPLPPPPPLPTIKLPPMTPTTPTRTRVAPRGMRTKRSRSESSSAPRAQAELAFDAKVGSWVVVPSRRPTEVVVAPLNVQKLSVSRGEVVLSRSAKGKGKGKARAVDQMESLSENEPHPLQGLSPYSRSISRKSPSSYRPYPHALPPLPTTDNPPPLPKKPTPDVIYEYGAADDVPSDTSSTSSTENELYRSYVDDGFDRSRSPSPIQYARRNSIEGLYDDDDDDDYLLPSNRRRNAARSAILEPLVFSDNPSPVDAFDDWDVDDHPRRGRQSEIGHGSTHSFTSFTQTRGRARSAESVLHYVDMEISSPPHFTWEGEEDTTRGRPRDRKKDKDKKGAFGLRIFAD
ncbi:uncharacterized protein BT62DRAFT_84939 [Guyanagaster necrorhizus]|uniref:Uncharacterized protein n=1 Tax=Guyanagaster necrorhizus TaxID=856835 RepID=A0A9P8AT20_9AGAR|nr:uncharacterized protein BT62DRAFT_84939 [Guyanagaster necrorhizus MCA 3950]KAG7446750.1 hypothetical protein BT62DRAFT_84939 [Guyanagaster necrorhizus MCA 3950]